MRSRPRPYGIAGHRRRNRIAGQFTGLLTEMLESPAWYTLSLSARRVLDRVAIELRHHGGYEGEGLCVTYADFEKYGMDRHSIAPAIREAMALGFLRIARQGRAGNSEYRHATLYRLTFLNKTDGEPTHDWRRIKSIADAEMKAGAARSSQRRKTKSQWGKIGAASVGENRGERRFLAPISPHYRDGKTPHYF